MNVCFFSSEKLSTKVSHQRPFGRHQLCDQPTADWRGGGGELWGSHQEYRAAARPGGDLRWAGVQPRMKLAPVEKWPHDLLSSGCAEGYARDATEIQNIQIAEGDVCHGLSIPIYMVFPRLFTCPTLETTNFKVGQ